jgi:hypothetical protein
MPSAVAAQNIGVGACRGKTYGNIPEPMARIAPSQPNEAMARLAPRKSCIISLDPSCRVKNSRARFFRLDSKLFSKVQIHLKRGLGSAVTETWELTTTTSHHHQIPQLYMQSISGFCWIPSEV